MSSATIKSKDFEIELPIIEGTENEKAIDITSLRSSTGHITLDTGYGNTGSCQSSITYIDGEKGILRYRGYPIEDLVNSGISFTDVSYLLIHGELSESDKKTAFKDYIRTHANIHEDMNRFFKGFPVSAHPMAILSSMVTALSSFHPDTKVLFTILRENTEIEINVTLGERPSEEDLAEVYKTGNTSYDKLGLMVVDLNSNFAKEKDIKEWEKVN